MDEKQKQLCTELRALHSFYISENISGFDADQGNIAITAAEKIVTDGDRLAAARKQELFPVVKIYFNNEEFTKNESTAESAVLVIDNGDIQSYLIEFLLKFAEMNIKYYV